MIDFIDEQKIDKKVIGFFKNISIIMTFLLISLIYGFKALDLDYFKFFIALSSVLLVTSLVLTYLLKHLKFILKVTQHGIAYYLDSYKKFGNFIPYSQIQSFVVSHDYYQKYNPYIVQNSSTEIIIFPQNDVIVIELKSKRKVILSTKNSAFLIETIENYLCRA